MPKCKKCNQEDLTWDRDNFEKEGKWRLWNPQSERPHECSMGKKQKNTIFYHGTVVVYQAGTGPLRPRWLHRASGHASRTGG